MVIEQHASRVVVSFSFRCGGATAMCAGSLFQNVNARGRKVKCTVALLVGIVYLTLWNLCVLFATLEERAERMLTTGWENFMFLCFVNLIVYLIVPIKIFFPPKESKLPQQCRATLRAAKNYSPTMVDFLNKCFTRFSNVRRPVAHGSFACFFLRRTRY